MEDYPKHSYRMVGEGLDKVCKWDKSKGMTDECPHVREVRDHNKKIKDDITDCVGNTPLVRINNITKAEGIECEILAKCEFLNPGGSVKDRIGRRMIVDALKTGRIKKGDIIIEPTSGNTGIGLSVAAASKGFRMIITMPEKMSQEKRDVLKALGAEIIRTPNEYAFDHANCHIGLAVKLQVELENAHMLDQYKNPANPMVHYEETGQEIYDQCDGKLDYVFIGAGTGGTLAGISRKLKELNSDIKIIGIDPFGSILAEPEALNTPGPEAGYQIEGIGYDFIPRVLDRSLTDEWMKIGDEDAFYYARRLIKEEGFLCGGSSGTALAACIKYIKANNIGAGKRCVFLCPDNIRNYITKFINNDWMFEHGFISEEECADANVPKLVPHNVWGKEFTIKDLKLPQATFLPSTMTIKEAIVKMKEQSYDQYPVQDPKEMKVVGMLTSNHLLTRLSMQKVVGSDQLSKVMIRDFRNMSSAMTIPELSRVLERQNFVLVDGSSVASSQDVLNFMTEQNI